LPNALRDAKAIRTIVERFPRAAEATYLIDKPKDEVDREISRLGAEMTPDDRVVFFCAGHGVQKGRINHFIDGQGQGKINLLDTIYNLWHYPKREGRQPGRITAAFLDCCRENAFNAGQPEEGGAADFPQHLTTRDDTRPKGLSELRLDGANYLTMFAAGPNRVANERLRKDDQHSPFTTALMSHLPDRASITDVAMRVTAHVVRTSTLAAREVGATPQVPWIESSLPPGIFLAGRPRPGSAVQ
jgi:hypothetical protein